MSHLLHVIPDSTSNAAQNMAYDFLLLQRYQPSEAIRFRHYEWSRPAFTFGLSQQFSYVSSEISDPHADLCRRPTGGGVVNHLDDWTYALVIPVTHPLAIGPPVETYLAVHQCLITAMGRQGIEVELNATPPAESGPSVCFNKAELYDVVLKNFPSKVAGAAQKRTKHGFLMQGSIWKPMVSSLEWNRFYNDFIIELATVMDAQVEYVSAPSWQPSEAEALSVQFDSDQWNKRR